MPGDSEKLTTILPYIRALGEDTKKKLDRFRQSNGNGVQITGIAYGELLDQIYEVHLKFQKEKEEQCRPFQEKLDVIEKKLQSEYMEKVQALVEKTVSGINR